MSKQEDRGAAIGALFARRVPDADPYAISRDVYDLRKAARSLERLAIAACNYELTHRQRKRSETLTAEIRCIASGYAMDAHCNGDPRGLVVRLIDPANPSAGDGFGGGWGVY